MNAIMKSSAVRKPFRTGAQVVNRLNCWYDPKAERLVNEGAVGFAGNDTNLTRYVANTPLMATDPTGLTKQLDVAVLIAKGSYAKHKLIIDAVLAKATAVLKDLDIALNFTIVEVPVLIVQEKLVGFDVTHDTRGALSQVSASDCAKYVLDTLKSDAKFLAPEFAASKIKKWDYVALIYTEGNGINGYTHLDTGIEGIQINLKDLIKGIGTIDEVGLAFAHEFVAHIMALPD